METLRPNGCFFLASGFLVKKAEGSRGEETGQARAPARCACRSPHREDGRAGASSSL